ncbi:hypothetical protein [Nesterenkonia alkaliphila]|uniref:Uncharacterized protein n=1 Tax=Nesterenkonia alkaliphila TaxID=1463631 RepID=A0A7K1UFP7_9MICC|nr:hypothetical protein [Nesterenkonia alkaliphila]MVT25252.1 hypothetical protein [Nesterenkonia alkaliphila]GFZ91468.1 hypothetical protein GCM10011359_21000 [Nesterenkonia alkaliphila]
MSKEVCSSMAVAFLVIAAVAFMLALEAIPGIAAWSLIIVALFVGLGVGGYLERRRKPAPSSS